ncbi:hypothetical protein GGR51DRAFT_354863 [Nemania sp. FL0031]|nr:hypothetical protein GGR51DRAFT_354863 [Nemania sp. FL0031]
MGTGSLEHDLPTLDSVAPIYLCNPRAVICYFQVSILPTYTLWAYHEYINDANKNDIMRKVSWYSNKLKPTKYLILVPRCRILWTLSTAPHSLKLQASQLITKLNRTSQPPSFLQGKTRLGKFGPDNIQRWNCSDFVPHNPYLATKLPLSSELSPTLRFSFLLDEFTAYYTSRTPSKPCEQYSKKTTHVTINSQSSFQTSTS